MRLDGKTAIVTGGAGGIGRGIVRAFSKEGAKVLFVDINEDAGQALQEELGDVVKFLNADISQPDTAAVVCATAAEAFGGVHVLVNNAHASRQAPLLETTQDMFDLSFNTGFYPTLHLMQACHAQLKKHQGSVINFGSGAGLTGLPTQSSYAAAKEAIRGLSRVAAHEWAQDNINVNIICPLAATEGVEQWQKQHPETAKAMISAVPLHRLGDPEQDIGRVAVFLASEDARYMTGQTLMVDGGSTMLR